MAITGRTRVVGVWGYPVNHSLSPVMQNVAIKHLGLDWVYVPFAVEPENVEPAVSSIRALDLIGVNVTVPLKELVVPLLDWVDTEASRIKSVNTIVNNNGSLRGYSTDGRGLMWDLADKGVMPNPGDTVLVLGAGGSARAVVAGLADSGCKVIVANRSRDRAERLVSELDSAAVKVIEWQKETVGEAAARAVLTINTTTIGMHPADSGNNSIINEGNFGSGQVFYDLVYSSSDTILMRIARTGGAKCFNGLGMLVRQGALSLSLWSGLSESQIPIQIMEQELIGHLA